MNNPESVKIIERFYEALDVAIQLKLIRGLKTFTDKHGINRWNLITVKKNHQSDMFQLVWLSYIINDFNISPEWLMTGHGNMFK